MFRAAKQEAEARYRRKTEELMKKVLDAQAVAVDALETQLQSDRSDASKTRMLRENLRADILPTESSLAALAAIGEPTEKIIDLIEQAEAERDKIQEQLDSPKIRVVEVSELFGKPIVESIDSVCVRVIDGNTIECQDAENESFKVRIESIECPEITKPFGDEARQRTTQLCRNRNVEIMVTGKEIDGFLLGFVIADGINLSVQLITEGLAWHDRKTSNSKKLSALEEKARMENRGHWVDAEGPISTDRDE